MTRNSLILISIFLIVGASYYAGPKILGYSAYDSIVASKHLYPGNIIQKDDLVEQWALMPYKDRYSNSSEVIGKMVINEIPEWGVLLKSSLK